MIPLLRFVPFALPLVFACTGCLAVPAEAVPEPLVVAAPEGLTGEDAEEYLFELTAEMFKKSRFEIDRIDRAYGEVVTKPMVAMGVGEFWRRDSVGFYNFLEATLNRIRRSAAAKLRKLPDGKYEVTMRVRTERYENPEKGMPNPGELIGTAFFLQQQDTLEQRGTPAGQTTVTEPEGGFWQDLGRDPQLERKLLVRLQRLLNKRAAEDAAAAEAEKAENANADRKPEPGLELKVEPKPTPKADPKP